MNSEPAATPTPIELPAFEGSEFVEERDERGQRADRRRRPIRRRWGLTLSLFLATCLSTFLVGLHPGDLSGVLSLNGAYGLILFVLKYGELPVVWSHMAQNGLVFSSCLMGILLAHEMGHFLQALRHRVPATLPYFIPFPITAFGTMGAVIVQDGSKANRRQLFDIAVSGPLAGLLVALPITWYGVSTSQVLTGTPGPYSYGDPLLLRWIVEAVHGAYGPNQDILINAPLFAGWVGIFITALNLLPIGQLDGGHILYTLIGKRAHLVAYGVMALGIVWMAVTWRFHYALIFVLLLVFGTTHPPTADDRVPLGSVRTVLGWLSLAFVVIGFTPTPILM